MNGGSSVKRILFGLVCMLFLARIAPAQTISPVIVEYPEKADGRFQIYNDGDLPLMVVVEPHSFSVDSTGKSNISPARSRSARRTLLHQFPRGTQANLLRFLQGHDGNVSELVLHLRDSNRRDHLDGLEACLAIAAHRVYLLGRKSLEESKISWNKAEISVKGDRRQITAEIENHGTEYGRVQEVDVLSGSGSGKQTFPGFPLFPGQKRDIELDWDQPGTPSQIVLKFPKFKMESELKEPIVAQQSQP